MSITARIINRSHLLSVSRVISNRNCLFPRGHHPNKTNDRKFIQYLVHQNTFRSFSSELPTNSCWNCGKAERRDFFFCKHCDSLQKPDANYNFFHLYDIEESFDIKSSELSKTFHQLQALLHPDKFSNAPEKERQHSASLSSLVNKAFKTLSDPLERGLYLLGLQGLSILEENTSFDKEFLLEVMELNEELESICSSHELEQFHSKNKERLSSIIKKISESFSTQDTDSARAALMQMKYFSSLESKIKEKMLQF